MYVCMYVYIYLYEQTRGKFVDCIHDLRLHHPIPRRKPDCKCIQPCMPTEIIALEPFSLRGGFAHDLNLRTTTSWNSSTASTICAFTTLLPDGNLIGDALSPFML